MQDFSTALGSQRHFVTTGDSSPSAPTFPETPELPTQMFLIFIEDWISSLPGKDSLPTELSPPPVPQFLFLLCLVSNSISKETHLTSPAVHAVAAACCSTMFSWFPGEPLSFSIQMHQSLSPSPPSTGLLKVSAAASTAGEQREGEHLQRALLSAMPGGCLWPSR